jgi:ABC-2 type transport system permease protein
MSATTGSTAAPEPMRLGRGRFGLGSVFGKTIRDSRRATLIVGTLMGFILIGVSYAIVTEFNTPESRRELEVLVEAVPPIMQGLGGRPIEVGTLGGYLNYKYGAFFPIIVGLWSIIALSGTLAVEARRGSMELVAATGRSRRRIAIEKVLGHAVMLSLAMVVVFVSVAIAGTALDSLPGDAISVGEAAGYAVWLGLMALAAGSVAFAVSQFFGRGAGLGIGGAVMFTGWILNGYREAVPALAPFANLTWFGWTTDHIPVVGMFDWPSVGLVAVAALVFLAIGVEAFARRDLGAVSNLPTPSLPGWLAGLRGPTGRAFGDGFTLAVGWGIGLGLFGLLIAGSGRDFIDQLNELPEFVNLLKTVFPDLDFASVGGFLQLLFLEFGLVLVGLAAATLVGRWASDESSGRLDMLLATPMTRARWVAGSGAALLGHLAVIVALTAAGILVGTLITGGDPLTPMAGTLVLGAYGAAMAGVGFAVGGLFRTGIAVAVVTVVTFVTWFLHVLGPGLRLPDWLVDLSLAAHFGQPMVGSWDWTGLVASVILALGGIALGAWGFARRDLRG